MKNLVIIGAGGCGRDIHNLALDCTGNETEFKIVGFLDDNPDSLKGYVGYAPVISSISGYVIQTNDVFVAAMGNVSTKRTCVEIILGKGGQFINLIHPTAYIAPDVHIGMGSIVMQRASICASAVLGDFVLVQISAVVGHDAKVGNFSRLDCLTVMVGGTELKEEVTVHTSSIINQKVVVGKQAKVGASSLVIRNVKEGTTVIGNPARCI